MMVASREKMKKTTSRMESLEEMTGIGLTDNWPDREVPLASSTIFTTVGASHHKYLLSFLFFFLLVVVCVFLSV